LAAHGEAHEVGLRAAGDEGALEGRGQPEEVTQHCEGVVLQGRGRGLRAVDEVLIRGRHEKVPSQGRRAAYAGDEAQVAGARGTGEGRQHLLGHLRQDGCGSLPLLG
jgi:hypothetical protein